MRHEVRTTTLSVVIPSTWYETLHDECLTLQAEQSIGALQISSYTKDSDVTDEDLQESADRHLKAGAKSATVSIGPYAGFTIAYGVDGLYWREWYLRHKNQMLYVTYNCENSSRGKEDAVVKEILTSLKPLCVVA